MNNLTGFIVQVFRGKALLLSQVAEDGTTFPCDSQMGWAPGDGVRNIDGRLIVRFPASVAAGVTKNGLFQVANPVSGYLGQRCLFDTAPSEGAGYVAVNVRAI